LLIPTAAVLGSIVAMCAAASLPGQTPPLQGPISLDSTPLQTINSRILWVEHRGRRALNLAPLIGHEHDTNVQMSAVLTGSDFHDGAIEVDVAGARRAGYPKTEDEMLGFKGMIGVSFRIRGDSAERFYVRPEHARLQNQLYRNLSTQYESMPDYPFDRLRGEHFGQYESFVDLEPGAWEHLKIVVSGSRAALYVNGAAQPCLIVTDLKLGDSHGAVALWARISTDAYFSNLRIEPTA
jgi:hypothetical protein